MPALDARQTAILLLLQRRDPELDPLRRTRPTQPVDRVKAELFIRQCQTHYAAAWMHRLIETW